MDYSEQNELLSFQKKTAIYPNRIKDKEKVERELGLEEFGEETTKFYTSRGSLIAEGYKRIVYGDHGPYIEFNKSQIKCVLVPKFNTLISSEAYYEWLTITDGSNVKVYDQKRTVKNLKNPPNDKNGFQGNRKEGYADYKVEMIYINPFDLKIYGKN